MIETVVLKDNTDVEARLAAIGVDRKRLLDVVRVGVSAGADATPFHAANAAGTLAYHLGTWALRDKFVGGDWVLDRKNGIESIKNETTKVKIVFQNVDVAASDTKKPKPRSNKGPGSEEACSANLFDIPLPEYAPRQDDEYALYYLMADERGAAELTRPVVKNDTFSAYVERIYLSDGSDFELTEDDFNNDDAIDEFDPQVARK